VSVRVTCGSRITISGGSRITNTCFLLGPRSSVTPAPEVNSRGEKRGCHRDKGQRRRDCAAARSPFACRRVRSPVASSGIRDAVCQQGARRFGGVARPILPPKGHNTIGFNALINARPSARGVWNECPQQSRNFGPSMVRRASARRRVRGQAVVVTTAKQRAERRLAASGKASSRGTPKAPSAWRPVVAKPESRPTFKRHRVKG